MFQKTLVKLVWRNCSS